MNAPMRGRHVRSPLLRRPIDPRQHILVAVTQPVMDCDGDDGRSNRPARSVLRGDSPQHQDPATE